MLEKIKEFLQYDHAIYENILDDPNSKAGKFFDTVLFYFVLIFCGLLMFETIGNNAIVYYKEIFIIDAFISTTFAIEYIYRFLRAKKKIEFWFNPIRIIDLLSFLPFFIGYFTNGSYLRVLRIIRFLRMLRLVKRIPLTSGFIASLKDYVDEYKAVFTLYFVILFLGATFVYYAEREVNGGEFSSILTSMWWALVTVATVGYGDISPQTDMGRFIGSFLVFLGPLIGALIGAITIMVFMEAAKHSEKLSKDRYKICPRCKTLNQKEANYCMKCAEKLMIGDKMKKVVMKKDVTPE